MRVAVAGATGRVGRHVVDVLTERGHDVVPMSRSTGVDVVTGEGLAQALTGVECLIDVVTGPSTDTQEATAFFTAATRNMLREGERAGVRLVVLVSIIGIDRLTTGHPAGKLAQEKAWLAGSIPVRILRADVFHEFIEQMMGWGRQGDVVYLPKMRRQPVAPRTVAEALVDLATAGDDGPAPGSIVEIAGPRVEDVADLAAQLAAWRGEPVKIEVVSDPTNPDTAAYESGQMLAGPGAIIAGPTFSEWLGASATRDDKAG